jgi:hypothetical protein
MKTGKTPISSTKGGVGRTGRELGNETIKMTSFTRLAFPNVEQRNHKNK